jgi:hypothetical protein
MMMELKLTVTGKPQANAQIHCTNCVSPELRELDSWIKDLKQEYFDIFYPPKHLRALPVPANASDVGDNHGGSSSHTS